VRKREKMRESEKMNIKMYENEIGRRIVYSNMKYKFDKYYNRERKESLINNGFCEFYAIIETPYAHEDQQYIYIYILN
jgi:hypothetical protein